MTQTNSHIILYTSRFCGHAWAVERFLDKHGITVELVSIDNNPQARQQVEALNNGYASVPTLIFPDGTQLTEPSFRELRSKLGIESTGLISRVRRVFSRDS